ncbi:DNA polymerase III subunit alpha [bacterium]|nr:DNA polymerase III subunit alpha [bacterium]
MPREFVHLHNHTDYSFLDGATKVQDLCRTALELGQPAVAITDHGNLCGAVDFYTTAKKVGIKPIIGCELYLTDSRRTEKGKDTYGRERPIYHQLLIAKNETGWRNLIKLSSVGYTEGFYRKPRIDYDILEQHHEGLICLSGCIQSHINQTILHKGTDEALHVAGRLQDLFGEDFYIELQSHGIEDETVAMQGLIEVAKRIDARMVVTNDAHYTKREHADVHDVLLCVQTKSDIDDPRRFRFDGQEFYLKTGDEMAELFPDHPEAVTNTLEVAEKVEFGFDFSEKHFPKFPHPESAVHLSHEDYLMELAEAGLPKRYGEVTQEIRDRLEYEMGIIRQKQLAGYFLIVRDFIKHAKDEGIFVGPGRGSAAGCLVSYLVEITDIDPMKYDLLFERFINPERESYPDIDVDFADARRAEVIEYVRKKYGTENVGQIITYGRMMSKGAVRDVGRVLKVPLKEVDEIAKLIPDTAKTLEQAMEMDKELADKVNSDPRYREMMDKAMILEGTIRNAGVHAAGIVITPKPLDELVPLYKVPDGDITTQFDMTFVEKLGLLKVDFLGLKTLTILERTLRNIKRRGIEIDLDTIPLDDEKTYDLFARGDTIGIFQFESSGMRENLRKLKPTRLEDLIAMNALYRPGPMDHIDEFCDRKHGRQKITYLHDSLANILDETYGIIVYQEQVMLIAHRLAGFTLGRADVLRKAMGKKKEDLMAELKPEFVKGCVEVSGFTEKLANELWDLIKQFARYGFNKSHAAGYALVAYQTGYLKAHYPAEFMAASLTTRSDNTDELVLFLEECRHMKLDVLPPDVNESVYEFSVPQADQVRFGMCAIKGVGMGAIDAIVGERKVREGFTDLFDLSSTAVSNPLINKKVLETLIYAGATESLSGHRAQQLKMLDAALSYAQQLREEKARGQTSIFGDMDDGEGLAIPRPELPDVPEMEAFERLKREKELLGFYFSGHPMLDVAPQAQAISTHTIVELPHARHDSLIRIAGMLQNVERRQTKKGDLMGRARLEDLTGAMNLVIFPGNYERLKPKLDLVQHPVAVTGRLQLKDETPEMFVDEIEPLDEAVERLTRRVIFNLSGDFRGTMLIDLERKLKYHPGNATIRFVLHNRKGEVFHLATSELRVNPDRDLIGFVIDTMGKEALQLEAEGPRYASTAAKGRRGNGNGWGNGNR